MIEDPTNPFDGAPSACPFVAFEDDRDHRSSSPDYRHRCFAAPEPEPRAFPHQERFCLSADFARCPIFLDWARQEAAGVKIAAAEPAAAPTVVKTIPADDEGAPAFLAVRPRTVAAAEVAVPPRRSVDAAANLWSYDGDAERAPLPTAPLPPSSMKEPAVVMARRGPTHPGWENPPRLETFPRLRSRDERRANQPLLFVAIGMALVMASLVLFPIVVPRLTGSGASPSPEAVVTDAPTPTPTVEPSTGPTFLVYIVKKTDLTGLSGIAAKYNVTVADLIAANPNLKNPNVIWEGMVLNIPPIGWHAPSAT